MTVVTTLAHISLGVIAAASTQLTNGWAPTLALTFGFIAYEVIEQRGLMRETGRLDTAYEEIGEYLTGYAMGILYLLVTQ